MLVNRLGYNIRPVGGEPMIVRRHCEALSEVSSYFTSRGIRPFMAARTGRDDRALAFVRAGLGVTVMPHGFAGEGIALPALAGFSATRTIGVIVHPESERRMDNSRSLGVVAEAIRAAATEQPGPLPALAGGAS